MWRTLIGVEEYDNERVLVRVPGWDPHKSFYLDMNSLPEFIQQAIKNGQNYLHAKCDLGAEEGAELVFIEWEAE